MKEIAIILLAAGSSSRMGQSKQKLLIEGKPLLAHAVEIALKSNTGKVIVVLGSEEETHRELLKSLQVNMITNPRWQTGMGSSIKAGLNHVLSSNPKTEAVIIAVCDQPLLQPHHFKMLIAKQQQTKAPIVASAYSNTKGVPALFKREIFGEILELNDPEGAKKVIQQHPAEVIDFSDGAIDLDTPEDYKNFLHQHSKKMP